MKINILLFDDFETLDAFGPVEILARIPNAQLKYFSLSGGLIQSRQGYQVMTESVAGVEEGGILLIPGGQGTRLLVTDISFLATLAQLVEQSEYCLSVCTGAALLACTALLDQHAATSNKKALAWVKALNRQVLWRDSARWVVSGKFYTSSGVSAGMDMSLGFVCDRFGETIAQKIATDIEYIWNADPEYDPFTDKDD